MLKVIDPDTGEECQLYNTDELTRDYRAYMDAHCQHPTTEVRKATVAGGAIHYRAQCLTCGELVGQAIGRAQAPRTAAPADTQMLPRYQAERERQYQEMLVRHLRKQQAKDSTWWKAYTAYLKTPEWRARRDKVLKRAQGLCEGCGNAPASQVHHLTYEHVCNEFLWELVAICDACHDRIHDAPEGL